jgi:hypothetical protein
MQTYEKYIDKEEKYKYTIAYIRRPKVKTQLSVIVHTKHIEQDVMIFGRNRIFTSLTGARVWLQKIGASIV